ncbi:acetolactate synthase 1 catalytic subunit [Rhodococcus opacus M213]|uniref:acetolactate synthase n=1 Tax=Rhodococcus opacus M213 TaxID=1129896 RepID=K8XI17_RHOOP|nr:acetolactate synthase 1 catalytic subunit [Rhodococcus opacus M213]
MTGAQSVVRSLEALAVEVVFGIPGGAILPVYDPLIDSQRLRHVLVRHEQGAGHAATGYAQATGKVGVCMATSGPGATNLVTPLADAQMDSVPVVAITGQVGRGLIGTDAFQEADICGITMPITKHNFLVTDPKDIPRTLAEAFRIAATGRPGAVLVDIPKDVLQATTTFAWPPATHLPGYRLVTKPHGKQIRAAADLIAAATAPVLYIGGGVIKAEASAELAELAELTGIPVVTTLMARGAFPDSHRLHYGMPGMHGTRRRRRGAAEERPVDRARCPVRRPRHRGSGLVRPGRPGHSRRHRPRRDRQEPIRRCADRRRLQADHHGPDRRASFPPRPNRMVEDAEFTRARKDLERAFPRATVPEVQLPRRVTLLCAVFVRVGGTIASGLRCGRGAGAGLRVQAGGRRVRARVVSHKIPSRCVEHTPDMTKRGRH